MTVAALTACVAVGQNGENSLRFEAADVHPTSLTANNSQFSRGPFILGARYDLHSSTMVDLISKAYGVVSDKVLEGPSWLEYDRFDVSALMPPKTSSENAKLMLQALLADRFQLVLHKEDRPLPAYVLSAPKGKQKLKEADGSGDTGCRMTIDQARSVEGVVSNLTLVYTCRSMTMTSFAEGMTNMAIAQQYVGTNPVQDKTGLEGKWDFTLKYNLPTAAGAPGDNITIQDAVDKQLGLKLEQQTISLPVLVVDKLSRAPSPNAPDVSKKIPALPAEFEVATVKPMEPIGNANGPIAIGIRFAGGRVEMSGLPLKTLILQAWGVQADSLVGGPKFLDTDRYSIVGKMPAGEAVPAPNSPLDQDAVGLMLRALLAERFNLKTHFEERPMTAYTLTAPKPKLKKADPSTRTKWTDGNTPIVLSNGNIPSRTVKFQNMSMAQLAEKLQSLGSAYIHAPVLDGTGLEGSYDFTLTFSPIAPAQLATLVTRAAEVGGGAAGAADPMGGVTLFDAIDKQLGLKLVEQKRPVRVLVIDHIDEKPTDN
jgi:uncharacterized protein (TIGR03435 family)